MGQVFQAADHVADGIVSGTKLAELGVAPVCLAPGKVSGEHSHNLVEEINIFKSGMGQIRIENDVFDVCEGSVAVIPAGQYHEVCNIGDENLEYVAVFNKNVDRDAVKLKSKAEHFGENAYPGYLRILNLIAAGEKGGEKAFRCWAEKTGNPELKKILKSIVIREAEHSAAFEKRLCELGCEVDFSDVDEKSRELFDCLQSDADDLEKLARFCDDGSGKDPFAGIFRDKEIDPETGALLGRFIAEERDTVRMLQNCYVELCATGMNASGTATAASEGGPSLQDICEAVTSLTGLVGDLKKEVAALKAAPAPAPKPKASPKRKAARAKA